MFNILEIKEKIFNNENISKEEALEICKIDINILSEYANEIRKRFCKNDFNICTIINGKSGLCSEDCKYCAQSKYFKTDIEVYGILSKEEILKSAISNYKNGVHRFSIVTSGKLLNDKEIEMVSGIYEAIGEKCNIGRCASHGLLSLEQLYKLKQSGVTRYHNNLETSRKYFPQICTTHTYDEKIETIKNAKKVGLEVCSGGIIGMGESIEDRIDMAFELRELNVDSIPINILNPVLGTPFENREIITYDEVIKTISIIRFIMPEVEIRLAGGRALLADKGERAFKSGINSVISGDMLTTVGIKTSDDINLVKKLGFEVKTI